MRIDRLLCYLRFVKTRSQARRLIEQGHSRCNGTRIIRASLPITESDILTLALGKTVRIVEILQLPTRRGSVHDAKACYRVLDPQEEGAIAEAKSLQDKGNTPP
ncbi:S4 domain-containing protein [Pontixanthobacter gangjinensis]|uniref:RNA-binding S4 domain-containing protein n=1 Tax=Pontixanthobacter gangjinensis TaxID=1028742 RepID=A0A6I4SLI4_9SPHN|nr:S4 domain-containing protein [Pontixanthobacter gangjinensis]MXO55677.1 RNA-binding S4 domain-containing protein [Pontixanthobacter gangjinensis]